MNYELLSYAELRVIAKSLNIPANIKKDSMIKQIQNSSLKIEETQETTEIETKTLNDNDKYNKETLSSMVLSELRLIGDKYNISNNLKKSLMIDAIISAVQSKNEIEENILEVEISIIEENVVDYEIPIVIEYIENNIEKETNDYIFVEEEESKIESKNDHEENILEVKVEIPIIEENIVDVEIPIVIESIENNIETDDVDVEEEESKIKNIDIENELIIATAKIVLETKMHDELRIEKEINNENISIAEETKLEKKHIENIVAVKNFTQKKNSKTNKCLLSSFTACLTEGIEENNNPNIITAKIDQKKSNKKTFFTSPTSKIPMNIQNSENDEIICLNSIKSTSTKWNYEDFDKSPQRPTNVLRGIASPHGKKIDFTNGGQSPVPNQTKNNASKWGYEDFNM
jgi:hypothetical protein